MIWGHLNKKHIYDSLRIDAYLSQINWIDFLAIKEWKATEVDGAIETVG